MKYIKVCETKNQNSKDRIGVKSAQPNIEVKFFIILSPLINKFIVT